MKKTWEEPKIMVQKFVANEYVATCGDSGTVYNFVCDAGNGVYGSVYQETNGQPGLQADGQNSDTRIATYLELPLVGRPLGGYHACGTTHKAESNSGFFDGYYCARGNTYNPLPVIIWKGEHSDNVHCTTNLNIKNWETAKS